jgi:type IV pilus assembly protein PilC
MIAIGEESGSLDTIANELASFYEEEVDQTMSNLSSIIEPILMLVLGLGVAGMAIAVILPIYSLSQQIG